MRSYVVYNVYLPMRLLHFYLCKLTWQSFCVRGYTPGGLPLPPPTHHHTLYRAAWP